MTGTIGTNLRRVLIGAVFVSSTLALQGVSDVAHAGASLPLCGVAKSASVRVSDTNQCVVHVLIGGNVHFTLGSGFRWGNPVSSSRDVVVTTISRTSIGVDAATLRAAKIGRAVVQDTGTKYCKAGVACPDLALLWRLHVIVVKRFAT